MIINLRGTGGAGKSHIVREVMRRCQSVTGVYVEGRGQPIGYNCVTPSGGRISVVGHYETPCGGCDTITKIDDAYARVYQAVADSEHVIYEGIIVQDDVRRIVGLNDKLPGQVLVLALDVPMEECLTSIRARRKARGDERELDPTNTVNRAKTLKRTMARLMEAGVVARWETREQALRTCLSAFGLTNPEPASVEAVGGRQFLLDFGGGE